MKGLSPKFPVAFDNTLGAYQLNKTFTEMIRQNMINLLLTNKGERVMDINFGVGLRSYFFEPMVRGVQATIATDIRTQVSKYMPFVEINSIDFHSGAEEALSANVLGVTLSYQIIPLRDTDRITISETALGI